MSSCDFVVKLLFLFLIPGVQTAEWEIELTAIDTAAVFLNIYLILDELFEIELLGHYFLFDFRFQFVEQDSAGIHWLIFLANFCLRCFVIKSRVFILIDIA